MLRTDAVKEFLKYSSTPFFRDLYRPEMEVQVNVAQDNGQRIKGKYLGKTWMGWKDPETGEVWKNFRIPYNADIQPEYEDKELTFDLHKHVEGVGMTGWDWKAQSSLWVGFDLDSIVNHKAGISEEELREIRHDITKIPWVTVLKSTSGKGLHVYVFLESSFSTKTHVEHAALARAILSLMSARVGYNLESSVDVCGQVLWCYHRKMEGTDGLTVLHTGESLKLAEIPCNWKDHVQVTNGKKKKIRARADNPELFDAIATAQKTRLLDDGHMRLLNWFNSGKASKMWWWDNDHNMLVCHTWDMKKAHGEMSLMGVFQTNSTGTSEQNCFAFPSIAGSWVIRRHGMGVNEHPSWLKDETGWTRCIFNAEADFQSVIKTYNSIESTRGDFVFQTVKEMLDVLNDLGIKLQVTHALMDRRGTLREREDGSIIMRIRREDTDAAPEGYLVTSKGDFWEQVISRRLPKRELAAPDHLVRFTISSEAEVGWYINTKGSWVSHSRNNVITVLSGTTGAGKQDIDGMMSKCILNPWEIVCQPFEDEYPGDRQWNMNHAAFSCEPEEGLYDTWVTVFKHAGESLNDPVQGSDWCLQNGIETGAEYLFNWVASMFQRPDVPLPYLFFVGPQNSGKSTLHEAISLLFADKRGYARADHALVSQSGFNSELANTILCVVEEVNLRQNKEASNRIKDWVTGRTISINQKYKSVYDVENTTHWMQCANDHEFCPVLSDDTRIVVAYIDKPETDIPKGVLFERLDEEKAFFLNAILHAELPRPHSRLGLPCIMTADKMELQEANMDELERFMKNSTVIAHGASESFNDFYQAFINQVPRNSQGFWTPQMVSRRYPKAYPYCKGKLGDQNTVTLGNLSMDMNKKDTLLTYRLNLANGRIGLERR